MRTFLALAALAAFSLAGCNRSPEGGAPGTSDSFTIGAPTMATKIKQDNKQSVELTLNRSSNFKQTVHLTVKAPEKIKAELSKSTIAPGDPGKFELTIAPAKDAGLGDHEITVTGTPDSGNATSVQVKVTVEKNP